MDRVICMIKKGDQTAFRVLYDNYKDKLYFFCLKYVKSEELARDILQETFIKIWNIRDKLDDNQNFDAFIFKLIKNSLVNYLKSEKIRRKHENEVLKEHLMVTNETEDYVVYNDYNRLLAEAINAMPLKRKEVYILSRYSGLSYDEIAQNLNISPNTVEIHIGKALRDIRSFIKKHNIDEFSANFKS